MLIKHSGINFQSPKHYAPIYFLLGQELLQTNIAANTLKTSWQKANDNDNDVQIQMLSASSESDWSNIRHEVNSYSLFSNKMIVDIHYEKKTLEAHAKSFFHTYLKAINHDCLIIFRCPNLPLKQITTLTNHESIHAIHCIKPSTQAILLWINQCLKVIVNDYDSSIPNLIYQYNEGNLLACAQVIKKLTLITEIEQPLTVEMVKEQLIDQCNYALFELGEACLLGNSLKVIQLLRQAHSNKTEATLILWCLSQEIRILLQLHGVAQNNQLFRTTANNLKIWANRVPLYQSVIHNYSSDLLTRLLQCCSHLDNLIKTNQSKQIWQFFEFIALSLCTKKQVGWFA